jgi:EAL domain-containing protein (putative c-di-GMP-specific phosphodiesterase class I)
MATAQFRSLVLASRYQPIYSLAEKRAVGYEGLLVATDAEGRNVPPAALFERASEDAVFVDWLARALHMRNFARLGAAGCRLFINVAPRTALEDPRFPGMFASVMRSLDIDPRDIVIEVLEHAVADEDRLAEAIGYYRGLGCGIALDDFGTGASGMKRLERLAPDIVKIARVLVQPASRDRRMRAGLVEMVATIQERGAAVVLEGIENATEARMALETGAEYVQGFWFAEPATARPDEARVRSAFEALAPGGAQAHRRAPPPARACGMAC